MRNPCVSENFVSLQKYMIMHKLENDNNIDNFVDGLYVKNGRLINGRPNSMTGIQKAANIKRMIDEDRKIKIVADGMERAEMRKNLFG
tara:strand:+ start:202 stop:465 length:264 start_codon:yes stop_codon:yes gene_type:complete